MFTRAKKYSETFGKHCFISGGSSGLGKELATKLYLGGCNVTIIGRTATKLQSTVTEIHDMERLGQENQIRYQVCDVTSSDQISKTYSLAAEQMEVEIDCVFLCAGAARPGLFVDQPLNCFVDTIHLNYLGSVFLARTAALHMKQNQIGGRIVFIASTLAIMNLYGYSSYAPTKHAIRSLAEILEQELREHKIKVHIYYVSTIKTPGYIKEQETKPQTTKEIEANETSNTSPAERAETLLLGIIAEKFAITSDEITDLFRVASLSNSPPNNIVIDFLKMVFAYFAIGLWRRSLNVRIPGANK